MISTVRVATTALLSASIVAFVALPTHAQSSDVAATDDEEHAVSALDRPALLTVEEVPLAAGLNELRDRSGVALAFSPSLLPAAHTVSCFCTDVTVKEALDRLLSGTSFRYAELGTQVLIEPAEERAPTSRRDVRLAGSGLQAAAAPAFFTRVNGTRTSGRVGRFHQQEGTISGRVVDAQTDRPLSGAQVFVPDTGAGTLTNAEGEFTLSGVAAGEVTVRVQMIGYSAGSQTVTVVAGETAAVSFELQEQALGLDEIVVTGTAGQARRREVGNTISQINVADIAAPPTNMEDLLQSRAPGMSVTGSSGSAGAGAQIRLRGNISVAMSNQPLIYIDGVRTRSEGYPRNVPPSGFQSRGANVTASPLNDINPADIERIEVLKGAAATTLYGTEAAAGVIQIFTKRGASGTPTWNAQIDQGFNELRPFGTDDAPYLFIDPWLRRGHRQNYALSVTGGGEDLQYFVSGGYEDNQAVLPNDWETRASVRGNFTFSPLTDVGIQFNTSYTNHDISNTPAGNNAHGLTLNAFRRDRNFFGDAAKEVIDQVLDYEIFTYIDRFTTAATFTHNPWDNFSHRLNVGFDRSTSEMRQIRPFGFFGAPQGIMSNRRWSGDNLTVDYAATLDWRFSDDIRSSFSVGGQSITTEDTEVSAYAEDFPGPGVPTISTGAQTLGFEERIRVINAGLFVQNLFDLRDRYFLTVGLRVDGNSAFGDGFGLQPYPKVSGSYVMSDESFWRPQWGQLKLRAAYGHAGRAPGAFDAVRTWDPIGWGGSPAFRPLNVGNPDLGPERTAETEVGLDASLFNDRLTADLTYYYQRTSNALFNVRLIPSSGFLGSQLENVGELENRGIEVALRSVLLQGQAFNWDFGLNVATNRSNVIDLGGAPPFSLGGQGWIYEDQPVPVIRGTLIRNADEVAEPDTEAEHFFGPNQPTHTIGFDTRIGFPAGIQLSARGEYMGGHFIQDQASVNALQRAVEWPICFDAYAKESTDQYTARERMWCIPANVRADAQIYPANFFRLRDITLRLPVGFLVPQVSNASLTLSARNWFTWRNSDFPIFDPEILPNTGTAATVRNITEHIPPAATVTASLRVVF